MWKILTRILYQVESNQVTKNITETDYFQKFLRNAENFKSFDEETKAEAALKKSKHIRLTMSERFASAKQGVSEKIDSVKQGVSERLGSVKQGVSSVKQGVGSFFGKKNAEAVQIETVSEATKPGWWGGVGRKSRKQNKSIKQNKSRKQNKSKKQRKNRK